MSNVNLKEKKVTIQGKKIMGKKRIAVTALAIASLLPACAMPTANGEEPLVTDTTVFGETQELATVRVTATRAPLSQGQQARTVSVIRGEDLKAQPIQSVNDVLKYVAAVDVRQKGPLGALTDVSIRGGNSEQITVLLNGINICDAQTAHNAFDYPIDKADIDHIEVLEGPAARVYGTSSLLGAINIVTKGHSATGVEAHVEGGSYGYLQAGARGSIASGRFRHSLSGSYTRSDGYLRSQAGNLNADYKAAKGFYQGSYADDWATFAWHAGISDKAYGSNTYYSLRFDNQFEHTLKTFTALQAQTLKGAVRFRPAIYWNRAMDRFELIRGDESKVPFNYHRTDVFGLNLNGWFDSPLGRTAFGAEMRHENIVSTTLGETLDRVHHVHHTNRDYTKGLNRTNMQLVLEHNILLRNVTISAGITAVYNSQADMNMRVYPGFDASWNITKNLKAYANYNASLRMPSFTELYYSVGGYKADPHLKPEELSSWEAGLKYQSHGLAAKAAFFHNHYKNLVDWIDDGTTDDEGQRVWKSVNFGKINAMGVEMGLTFDFRQLLPAQRLLKSANFSWCWIDQSQDAYNGVVSQYALEYLKNKVVADATFSIWSKLDLLVAWRLQHRTGSYLTREGDVRSYATYGLMDARMSWNEQHWTVYVEGNNLLDRDYRDAGNVRQPGFWFVAGATVKF